MNTPAQPHFFDAISLEDFLADERAHHAYDRAAALTEHIDNFCASPAWAFACHQAFSPEMPAFIYPLRRGFLGFQKHAYPTPDRICLLPIGSLSGWSVTCPLVGEGMEDLGFEAAARLRTDPDWHEIWLFGASLDSRPIRAFLYGMQDECMIFQGLHESTRILASLEGGLEGFLSRRSARFRKNARKTLRESHPAYTFEWIDGQTELSPTEAEALFERAFAVELRSWKGQEGTGIASPEMCAFYHQMLLDLSQRQRLERPQGGHRLRILFAKREGEDCAVLFGGVSGDLFRGMLNSFDQRYREESLGNLMQLETISRLSQEGLTRYELGLSSDETAYKAHWGEILIKDSGLHLRRVRHH